MTRAEPTMVELHQTFLELEEAAGLWDLRARGLRYWHYIRYDVWLKLLRDRGLVGGTPHGSWRDRSLRSLVSDQSLRRLATTLRRSLWTGLEPVDLLVFNHPRHVLEGGGWRCAYTAPLLDGLERSCCVIEQGFQGRHYWPNPTPGVRYLEWAKLAAYARAAPRGELLLRRGDRTAARRWARLLRRRLGGGPSEDQAIEMLRAAVRHGLALEALYDWLLDRVQPKLIVQVVHYSFRNLPMTSLAHRRGVPVAELQHGFVGPTHLAYNLAPGRTPETFPDHLLLFGSLWRQMTPGLPLPPERTPAIGFARLEALRGQPPRPRGSARRVLFISQGTIGVELSRIAVELARRFEGTDLQVVYRLHPSEAASWRQRYPWLDGAPLEVSDRPEDDIYDAFRAAHVQVGVYSTALFEGLAFGLPTFVVTLAGHEHMAPLLGRGLVHAVDDVEALEGELCAGPSSPDEAAVAELWQREPGRRFREIVDHLTAGPASPGPPR